MQSKLINAVAALLALSSALTYAKTNNQNLDKNPLVPESEKRIEKIIEKIIEKTVAAYGGKKLVNASSIEITDYSKMISHAQGESPTQPGFFRFHEKLTIDFKAKRKSMLSWRVSRTSKDLEKFIFDGKSGRIYDILNNKYSNEDWLTYGSTGGSITRKSDTLIAHSLYQNKQEAEYIGDVQYRGVLHNKVTTLLGNATRYTLFIDSRSGFISKMTRKHPVAGELSYSFYNHQTNDGLTYAQDLYFTIDGKTQLTSIHRKVALNPNLAVAFAKPADFTNWGETFTNNEITIRKLDNNVYHAGQARSYTLFVDAGEYFIAVGGHRGLKATYAAVKEYAGVSKPIKYMISTHHHNEHIPNLLEAIELGAKIVTVKAHLPAFLNHSSLFSQDNFVLINDTATFGEKQDMVTVYDIATMHADNYLLVHVPNSKLIFAEDHYETQLKTAVPRVHKDMVIFKNKVDALNIDVAYFLDGHTQRVLSHEEFNQATSAYTNVTCPSGYDICKDG